MDPEDNIWGSVPVVNDDDPAGVLGGGTSGGAPSTAAPSFGNQMLQSMLGPGGSILGSYLKTAQQQGPQYQQLAQQNSQFGQSLAEQEHQFNTQQQNRAAEVQRRNQLFQLGAPGLLANLGYSSSSIPTVLGQFQPNG